MDIMVENKKIIAVIPARGGSKRIPKKNIIDFHGKPMIAWTIEAALTSKLFEDVIVSTDDIEIAEVSNKYGAATPFIRDKFADDHTPVSTVTIHALEQLQQNNYDIVVQLMPNCPLRDDTDIKTAVLNFIQNSFDFQISCFQFGWMNPWWAYELKDNYTPKPIFEDGIRNRRSQDQPKLFCPTGAIWIASVRKLLEQETFYGDEYKFFPMNWRNAIDIDEYNDLEIARVLFK